MSQLVGVRLHYIISSSPEEALHVSLAVHILARARTEILPQWSEFNIHNSRAYRLNLKRCVIVLYVYVNAHQIFLRGVFRSFLKKQKQRKRRKQVEKIPKLWTNVLFFAASCLLSATAAYKYNCSFWLFSFLFTILAYNCCCSNTAVFAFLAWFSFEFFVLNFI